MPLQNFGLFGRHCLLLRAAQPDERAFRDLLTLVGFSSHLVSYRLSGTDEGDVSLNAEVEILSRIAPHARVIHDPRLGSGMNPDVSVLTDIAGDINGIVRGGEIVLVHCRAGRERTGSVCAAWRLIYGGATLADVEADLKAYGVSGLTAVVDHEIIEAVREIVRRVGK